jgi:hypothetical protein
MGPEKHYAPRRQFTSSSWQCKALARRKFCAKRLKKIASNTEKNNIYNNIYFIIPHREITLGRPL